MAIEVNVGLGECVVARVVTLHNLELGLLGNRAFAVADESVLKT